LVSTISGVIWDDENYNGIRDAGEPRFSGDFAIVTLYRDGLRIANSYGDNNGEYSFLVEEGMYSVSVLKQNGYIYTLQDVGPDDTIDSDANPSSGVIESIIVASGVNDYPNNDIGLYFDGSVECKETIFSYPTCGNDNGSFTVSTGDLDSTNTDGYILETSVNGAIFSTIDYKVWSSVDNVPAGEIDYILKDASGAEVCSGSFTLTDSGLECEIWVFTDCEGGVHYAGVELECNSGSPNGYTYEWSNGATTQFIENIVSGVYSLTITDDSGCNYTESFDIETETPSIFGHVWEDNPIYEDNVYDSQLGEKRLEDITVNLYDAIDLTTPLQWTATTADGYTFTNLTAGISYVVGIEVPTDYELVAKDDPDAPNENFDSDLDEMTALSDPVLIQDCDQRGIQIGLKKK